MPIHSVVKSSKAFTQSELLPPNGNPAHWGELQQGTVYGVRLCLFAFIALVERGDFLKRIEHLFAIAVSDLFGHSGRD